MKNIVNSKTSKQPFVLLQKCRPPKRSFQIKYQEFSAQSLYVFRMLYCNKMTVLSFGKFGKNVKNVKGYLVGL